MFPTHVRGVANPLYTDEQAKLAKALAAAVKGNGAPLLASYDDYIGRRPNGTYSTEMSANTAINCVDGRGINGVHAAVALQHRFVAAAPWFGRFTLSTTTRSAAIGRCGHSRRGCRSRRRALRRSS